MRFGWSDRSSGGIDRPYVASRSVRGNDSSASSSESDIRRSRPAGRLGGDGRGSISAESGRAERTRIRGGIKRSRVLFDQSGYWTVPFLEIMSDKFLNLTEEDMVRHRQRVFNRPPDVFGTYL